MTSQELQQPLITRNKLTSLHLSPSAAFKKYPHQARVERIHEDVKQTREENNYLGFFDFCSAPHSKREKQIVSDR